MGMWRGMSFVSLLERGMGRLITRATSFIDDFAAIVPYVMMWATFGAP